jgi:hypothetical protein
MIGRDVLGREPVQPAARSACSRVTLSKFGQILVHTMVVTLSVQVEVAGCPTVCQHCWAQGLGYQAMRVGEVAWVLEQVHRFCDQHALGLDAYPMHEVTAHPQAAEVLRLFADHVGAAEFEPLSTTGVPLAVRQDWQAVLAAAAKLGTTTVWVAFHGIGVEHDRRVNRPGAYAETCLAIHRIHATGLRAGCNVFLTTANAPQAEPLLEVLRRLEVEEMAWEPATFYPTPRGRQNERHRPRASDLLPVADRIRQLSSFHAEAWADPDAYTEAAWVARALASQWPPQLTEVEPRHRDQRLPLVCRPGLNVHTGTAGVYRERHGNLRTDGCQAVLSRALDQGGRAIDAIWFGRGPLPEVGGLAAQYGDPTGQRVHFTETSIRYLWLDRARRAGSAPTGFRRATSGRVPPLGRH